MGEVCSEERDDTVAYLSDGSDGLHLSFYLDFARVKWSAERFRESVGWLEEHIPADGWPCYYLNNHDLARTFTRLGGGRHAEARAKVAAAMLLTLRGTPIIYAGEEIGMPMSKVPRRVMKDPLGTKYWPLSQGRDGARTPMQWNADDQRGVHDRRAVASGGLLVHAATWRARPVTRTRCSPGTGGSSGCAPRVRR